MAAQSRGRRSPLVLAWLAAGVLAVVLTAGPAVPASAQTGTCPQTGTCTYTSTITMPNGGGTVTVVTTYVNGILVSITTSPGQTDEDDQDDDEPAGHD